MSDPFAEMLFVFAVFAIIYFAGSALALIFLFTNHGRSRR